MNTSRTVQERTEELPIEERLSKEIYSLDYLKLRETVPFGLKVQLQSFVNAAGFMKMHILYNEKWLSKISVNSSLCAFSHSLGKLNTTIFKLSDQELTIMVNVILETSTGNVNCELLHQILWKIVHLEESYSTLCKVFSKADAGFIDLKATTLEKMFECHPKLLNSACEIMEKKSEKEMQNSWILRVCSESPQIYEQMCRNLLEHSPLFLPKFVESICKNGSIMLLYPSYEQPSVLLCQILPILELPSRNVHNSKLIYELLQLWLTHQESVLKLITQFPCLVNCLSECCDTDVNAKRLCVQLMSYNPKSWL